MDWSVVEARARFSELVESATVEPQVITHRGRPAAVLVAPDEYAAFKQWREARRAPDLGAALDHVRDVCRGEGYRLDVPPRRDRVHRFGEAE